MGAACGGGTQLTEDVFHVPEANFSIPVRTVRKMGWKRDLPDHRDRELVLESRALTNLPASKDLRPKEHFHIYDQGHLGSCTANAIGAAFHYEQVQQGLKDFTPSRLFLYYNERSMEGNVGTDSGAYIRDGIKCTNKIGMCKESSWPYVESKFTMKPDSSCYHEAKNNKSKEYARVGRDLNSLKGCIAAGFPFVFGFTVYSSFQSRKVAMTGEMSMPTNYDKVMGGHAVMAIGYDDARKVFIVRNSWSDQWGDHGYFYMPYDYITHPNLADDFWAINWVTGTSWTTRNLFTEASQ